MSDEQPSHLQLVASDGVPRSRTLPDGWPHMYISGACDTCGGVIWQELFRPAVDDNWGKIAEHYRSQMHLHRRSCRGAKL